MTYTVFIDGGAGTTGLEIADRLSQRSEFELLILDDKDRKDVSARKNAINSADFVILCLPDEAAIEAVKLLNDDNQNTRFIDASSAHRVADGWVYGFAEMARGQREKIANARFVSNPGCYPTGFLALVAPLVARGLLPADWPYSVNAVSGYSGGGKALIHRFEESSDSDAGDIAFRAYGLAMGHKHLPEMQTHAGLTHAPLFAPSVINAYRGMLVEVPLPLAAMNVDASASDLQAALSDHYAHTDLVKVHDGDAPSELLLHNGGDGSDGLDLYCFADAQGTQIRLIAMLDNLGKGASGAAVQNLNIMAGLNENAGLMM